MNQRFEPFDADLFSKATTIGTTWMF